MNVFNIRELCSTLPKIFFDESGTVDIQRYDRVKYPIFKKLTDNHEANFWRPTEINLTKDRSDFISFDVAEEHVFSWNLARQIVLDSVQGRAPSLCFLPVVSDPWVESFINAWTFGEGIHSKSYTHIIENLYADPSTLYNAMAHVKEIVDVGDQVSKYYDELLRCSKEYPYGDYRTKEAFYDCMVATNGLEQIRFHVSFACTFSFANRKKIEGTGRIMALIRQDESIHCGFTQNVLKTIVKEDEDFAKIAVERKHIAQKIYEDIYRQEDGWIDYLFLKGPILGLTEQELRMYLKFLVAKSMDRMDLDYTSLFTDAPKKEPLVWMRKFLNEKGDEDQPPPQEEELTSYQTGNIDMNIEDAVKSDF